DLYKARSEIVHEGTMEQEADMTDVRTAFVNAFLEIAERLASLPINSNQPIGDILGDHPVKRKPSMSVRLSPTLSSAIEKVAATKSIEPQALATRVLRDFVKARNRPT